VKYYIVSFDRTPGRPYDQFHKRFIEHGDISRWSHYIKSSYIIGTSLSAGALSKHFRATALAFKIPTRHLVLRVALEDKGGWLPSGAWTWIRKQVNDCTE
jgi:hypothetical protein